MLLAATVPTMPCMTARGALRHYLLRPTTSGTRHPRTPTYGVQVAGAQGQGWLVGMHVLAGALILEPGLENRHFKHAAEQGVWLAKAGFGNFKSPFEYTPYVRMAQKHGMIVNVHTGGASVK